MKILLLFTLLFSYLNADVTGVFNSLFGNRASQEQSQTYVDNILSQYNIE
jgi:hypothetical protein